MRGFFTRVRCRLRRAAGADDGQALLEFAMVLPMLMLLVLGIVSYGLYINADVSLQQAARVGARAASIGDATGAPGDSALQEVQSGGAPTVWGVVDDQVNQSPGLSVSGLSVNVQTTTPASGVSAANALVTVTVSEVYHPVVPIPGLLQSSITLTQKYTMMVGG